MVLSVEWPELFNRYYDLVSTALDYPSENERPDVSLDGSSALCYSLPSSSLGIFVDSAIK